MGVAEAGRGIQDKDTPPALTRCVTFVTSQTGLVHSTPGPRKAQQDVEKRSLVAQVETSDSVENVDDDEDEVDAHGCQCLTAQRRVPFSLECTNASGY
jgi:hypothetical protein